MKNVWLFLLCYTILTNCRVPEDPFKRPKIDPIVMNGDGTGFRNGEIIEDTTNTLGVYPDEYLELLDHCEDKEFRLHTCIRFPRRCK